MHFAYIYISLARTDSRYLYGNSKMNQKGIFREKGRKETKYRR